MYAHAKAKSGGASATTSDSGFAARFGGGVDYWFTESISFGVVGSYVLPTGDLDGLDYFSLAGAIQYRF